MTVKINQIVVVKETREGEGRVALTPKAVTLLVAKDYVVMVENGAGALSGFSDLVYIQAGASMFTLSSKGFPPHSLILRVKRPIKSRELIENKGLSAETVMMGFLDPFDVYNEGHMARWQTLGVKTVALELLPLSSDDPKNAQAAMSRFAGRLALHDALRRYQGTLPKKVAVFGTGPAAMNAALTARELQLPVQLFGRQERHRQAVEAAGIIYQVLPINPSSEFYQSDLKDVTIIITAARSVGEKSPLLIDSSSLAILPDNVVLVDLSSGEGGNVTGSKQDQVVIGERGMMIINVSGYPKTEPKMASEAYAQCMVNLLADVMTSAGEMDLEHPVLCQKRNDTA